MPFYEVIDRVSKQRQRLTAESAQEACEACGWMIGNCFIRRVSYAEALGLRKLCYADLCLLEAESQRDGDDATHRAVVAEIARRADDARPPDTPERRKRYLAPEGS